MALEKGTKLGQYRIRSPIGAGGMGEVYLAHDTKLDRDVAIKVLPESMARDRGRLVRFEREAKLLASFNHSNIAAIHGFEDIDGTNFLVLEYVEGETLAQRLKQGPLSVEESLDTARQIAEALEAAHEKGVIHRDLKPGNVMVRPDGTVKVLDFGLARAAADKSKGIPKSQDASTITADTTRPGVVLGTAGYLSPEQARGRPVDQRTDIFAFGCILYEMLTGRGLFAAVTFSDSISLTLNLEPDWTALPAETPASVRLLLKRCLAKDCKRRLQAIGDARLELDEVASGESLPASPVDSRRTSSRMLAGLPWVLCGMLTIVLLIRLGGERNQPTPTATGSENWQISLPQDTSIGWSDTATTWSKVGYSRLLAISRDGRRIIQTVRQGTRASLYIKDGHAFTLQEVAGTDDARGPFFSPDGNWIGFDAEGVMQKVRLPAGGTPQTICPVNSTAFDATWLPNDVIIYSTDRGLYRVAASGGEPEQLTTLNIDGGERGHHFPHVLPGGQWILFTLVSKSGADTALLSLSGDRSWRVIKQDASDARFDPAGYMVFARRGELLAVPYDPASPFAVGTASPIAQGVHTTPGHGGAVVNHFATSDVGRLVYAPRAAPPHEDALVWVDHNGVETPIVSGPGIWMHQRLSPTGDRILFNKQTDDGMLDLYIHDIAREQTERLTWNGTSYDAEWGPEGKTVVFISIDTVGRAMFRIPADFSGPESHKLASGNTDRRPHLCDWTSDGSTVIYFDRFSVGGLWLADSDGIERPRQLLNTELKERWARVSEDGRLIAYVGGDDSQRREIYVQRYPHLGQRIRVSVNGGGEPLWSHDGEILFFRQDGAVFAAHIDTDPILQAGKPTLLFKGEYDNAPTGHSHFDLSLDGQAFLMVKHGQRYRPRSVYVVENWFEKLNASAPSGADR